MHTQTELTGPNEDHPAVIFLVDKVEVCDDRADGIGVREDGSPSLLRPVPDTIDTRMSQRKTDTASHSAFTDLTTLVSSAIAIRSSDECIDTFDTGISALNVDSDMSHGQKSW